MIEPGTPRSSRAVRELLPGLVRRALGAEIERVEPLDLGLGHRVFLRLHLRGATLDSVVARVDPGPGPSHVPTEPPLARVRAFLETAGLPVPARLGGDPELGIDLLEDLGSKSLEDAMRDAGDVERRARYAEACALIPRLQRLRDPSGRVPSFRRRLDPELVRSKARRFISASLPVRLGRAPSEAQIRVVQDAFEAIIEVAEAAPHRLAHRDFQSSNLMLRPSDGRLVMVDVQGAFLAPPEYDLVSLLRDSYVELPDDEVREHLDRTRPELPDVPPPETFARRFDLLTLARKAKDHALFHELAARGDPRRLPCVTVTERYLREAAARLAPLDVRVERLADLLGQFRQEPSSCGR